MARPGCNIQPVYSVLCTSYGEEGGLFPVCGARAEASLSNSGMDPLSGGVGEEMSRGSISQGGARGLLVSAKWGEEESGLSSGVERRASTDVGGGSASGVARVFPTGASKVDGLDLHGMAGPPGGCVSFNPWRLGGEGHGEGHPCFRALKRRAPPHDASRLHWPAWCCRADRVRPPGG